MQYQNCINPARPVFIDETWGPAPRGCPTFPGPGAESAPRAGSAEGRRPAKGVLLSLEDFWREDVVLGQPLPGSSGCVALP